MKVFKVVSLEQFIELTGFKAISLEQENDKTGSGILYRVPRLLEEIEATLRFSGSSPEVIRQEMKKYRKILKDISLKAWQHSG